MNELLFRVRFYLAWLVFRLVDMVLMLVGVVQIDSEWVRSIAGKFR
jgi:hypothetical protein